MERCLDNAERWLDHLYGLLSEGESRELAEHVAQCPACQERLALAQRDQRHMARAACFFRSIPEFDLPLDEQPRIATPAASEAADAPATLPLPKHVRRSLAQRLWPIWVAAAALLLAIFSALEWNRRGLADHERAVAEAKKQRDAIDAQFVDLKLQAETDKAALWQQAKHDALRVSVIGPNQIQSDAPSAYRVAARDLDGRVLVAQLDVKLVHADTGEVIHRQTVDAKGEVDVVLPAGLKFSKDLRLEVAAKHGTRAALVREPIQALPATHVVHLALNKSTYQLGEVLFFRALALERYSLRPTAESTPLQVALVNDKGEPVLKIDAKANPAGIVSGEFALVPSLSPGRYTVQVASADSKVQLQTQSRRVEIVEQLAQLDVAPVTKAYRPGEKAALDITVRGSDGKPIANQLVVVKPNLNNHPDVKGLVGLKAVTNVVGKATAAFSIPADYQGSRLNVAFEVRRSGKNGKFELTKIERSIPVIPARLEVDFYPEGGDLIAGMPQRVFFRVRTPGGETAAPGGLFSLSSSKGVIVESKDSLGSFTFTPDPKESYTLCFMTGSGVIETKSPFEKLGIKTQGVTIHVPDSVHSESDKSVRLEIKQAGPAKQLFAVASCRGQVVAQQLVSAGATHTDMTLPAGVRGVVRITLYEAGDQGLTPAAERLVYRTPAKRLDLTTTVANVEPKQTAQLKIEARNENNTLANAWALALVVDDRYCSEAREASLSGHFLLAGDIGGDLADLPLLADDTPATRQAVELFLGTYGWRRFVGQAEAPQIAQGPMRQNLFSAVSTTDEQARTMATALVGVELKKLQDRVDREQQQLEDQRQQAAASFAAAVTARNAYERLPMEYFRLGLGIVAALSFVAGAVCLTIGLIRAMRRRATTPAFVGAMVALGVCLLLYFTSGVVGKVDDAGPGDHEIAAVKPMPRIELALTQGGAIAAASPWYGQVALAAPPAPSAPAVAKYAMDLSRAVAQADGPAAALETSRSNFMKHSELLQRFANAEKAQQAATQPIGGYGREFAYRHQDDLTDLQPTVLWQPAVRIENGQATLQFDVPQASASYRVLVYGHSADGRLGFAESRLEVKAK